MLGDRINHFRIDHPSLCMFLLEPRVRKLDRNGLQNAFWELGKQTVEPDHCIAEYVMHVGEVLLLYDLVRFDDKRFADLDAQEIPVRLNLGHSQQKAPTCAADI